MIKTYLAHLQLRIEAVSKLLGNISEFKESDLSDVREGISEVINKIQKVNKDTARKFEKIKKVIDKYDPVIDTLPTSEKLTLVHAELQDLGQVAAQLDRIEKLLPALKTDNYLKYRSKYQNLRLLNTYNQVELTLDDKIAVKTKDQEPLVNIRSHHRKNINELAQLNGQVLRNLQSKILAISNRKLKESHV